LLGLRGECLLCGYADLAVEGRACNECLFRVSFGGCTAHNFLCSFWYFCGVILKPLNSGRAVINITPESSRIL
jgi:hypothetical protein